MKLTIKKAEYSGHYCSNYLCKKDPKYITKRGTLRVGVDYLALDPYGDRFYGAYTYCLGCIDDIYYNIKITLDPKLKAFR